jgi:hypothetical protein
VGFRINVFCEIQMFRDGTTKGTKGTKGEHEKVVGGIGDGWLGEL